MAKDDKKTDDALQFYSHLLIDQTKRAGFIFVFSCIFVALVYIIATNMHFERSWVVALLPVLLVASPIILYPPVEKWVYKPWQAKAQKYERHYRD